MNVIHIERANIDVLSVKALLGFLALGIKLRVGLKALTAKKSQRW